MIPLLAYLAVGLLVGTVVAGLLFNRTNQDETSVAIHAGMAVFVWPLAVFIFTVYALGRRLTFIAWLVGKWLSR